MLLGGKKKKVLKTANDYVAKPRDEYEWRIYWRDMGKLLDDAR